MANELEEGDYVIVKRDHKELRYEGSYLKAGTRFKVIKSFIRYPSGLKIIEVQFTNEGPFQFYEHEVKKESSLVSWLTTQDP